MPAPLTMLFLALLACAGAALWWCHRELRRARTDCEQQLAAQRARADQAEQRLLEFGEHLIALERRFNRALEQGLLRRAEVDAADVPESEQARQLRAASTAASQAAEADAEARLRALLAQRRD